MTEQLKEHFVDEAIDHLADFICTGEGDPLTALENLCRARSREVPREVYAVTENKITVTVPRLEIELCT